MVFSLVIFLAAGWMWVRSYWVYEAFGRWFAKTDAVVYLLGNGQTHRQEKRLVTQFRGVESIRGSIGIGIERWDMVNTSPAIFAVKWESRPDADAFKYYRSRAHEGPSIRQRPFLFDASDWQGWLGFGLIKRSGVPTIRAVVIPYWFLVVCAGVWPTISLLRWQRRRLWRRMGKCIWCGYDLRGSGEKCPECGGERNDEIRNSKSERMSNRE